MLTTKKIDPRPYQQKAAAAIHREWDAGNKKTLVVMPTGTGKTIVFASIVNDQVAKGEHVLMIPAAQPTQATPAVPPPFVPTAPAKSHEYYCCLARWDGSYIGYETYKSEQAAQNARKQIARRGETAMYATVEEAEAWVEQQKVARTRR